MSHIQILISVLCIFGIAHFIKTLGHSSTGSSAFHAAVWTSLFLYAGALIDLLPEVALSLRIIGGVGLLLLFRHAIRTKWSLSADTGFIIFSMIVFYLICNTSIFRTFSQVDDFTHWGRVSRFLTTDNALLTRPLGVPDYPPIAGLFQYFFTRYSGFTDYLAIFAQGVITISAAGLLLRPIDRFPIAIKTSAFLVTAIVVYSLPWILFTGLGTLQVDLLLGISFGTALISYYCREETNNTYALLVAVLPIALFMVLLKPIGILFASIALGAVSIDYIRLRKRSFVLKVTVVGLMFLVIFLGYFSWKQFLLQHGIGETFSIKKVLGADILNTFTNNGEPSRQLLTLINFGRYIFLSIHPSTYWFLVCVITGLTALKVSKKTDSSFSLTSIFILFGGFASYLLILLILYMFSFTEYEGTRLASFERYTITYLLGMLIFFGGQLLYSAGSAPISRTLKLWLLGIALLCAAPNALYFARYTNKVLTQPNTLYVNKVITVADDVLRKTPPTSKVYFIYSNGSNDESNVFHYLIHPRHSNRECSSVRLPHTVHARSDPWTCSLSVDEFKSKLMRYDYVIFAQTSAEFWRDYAAALKIQPFNNVRIYSISSVGGSLTLSPMKTP